MILALSPYHLTSRELPAMAAVLLGERVVTLLPAPVGGESRDAVLGAARDAPHYRAFMESWAWSMPLWRAGVISSVLEGEDAVADVRRARERLAGDPACEPLKPLLHNAFEAPPADDPGEQDLEAIAIDLLKGGPDPGISVPVAAGIDAFAARTGATVVRAHATSIAQKAESSLYQPLARLAIPVLTQAEGERIEEARSLLAAELTTLHGALASLDAGAVRAAGALYQSAFERHERDLTRSEDIDDERTLSALVSLTLVEHPGDAAIRSSVAAARAFLGGRARAAVAEPIATETPPVRSLIVKPLGTRQGD